jgi:hypothetical protein
MRYIIVRKVNTPEPGERAGGAGGNPLVTGFS